MKSFIAWDTETDLFGPGNQAPPLVCVSFALESGPNEPALLDHKSGAAWVRGRVEQALYNDSMVLCTHNGFYDYVVVANELQDAQFLKNVFELMQQGRVHDTLVGEWLLDNADGLLSRVVSTKTKSGYQPAPEGHYTLASLANKYAAMHLDKSGGARTSFGPLRGTPIEQWPVTHVAYAKEDAAATLAVAKAQRARAYADERRPLTNMSAQCRAYLSLQLSRVRGFATDLEATEHYARELLAEVEEGAKSLSKLHLPIEVKNTKTKNKQKVITFSIEDTPLIYRNKDGGWSKSTKVLQALIKNAYESQGEEPPRTDKGAVKTDADTLEQCDAPELEPWKDYERSQKLLGTYIPVLRQGVVHPGYGFTANGRSSSFKPNIQNCFSGDTEVLTPEGWVVFAGLSRNSQVAQWERGGALRFVEPISYTANTQTTRTLSNEHIDLRVTDDHRCLLQHRKTDELRVMPASEYKEDWMQINAGFGPVGTYEDKHFAELVLALQADGHMSVDGGVEWCFRKPRKIERLQTLLRVCNIPFTLKVTPVRTRIRVKKKNSLELVSYFECKKKLLSFAWLFSLSRATQQHLLEYVWFWDGCWTRKSHYASKHKHNASWVQTLCVMNNRRANVRKYDATSGMPSWQVDLTQSNYSLTTNINVTINETPEDVFCVEVPSSFLIVRRNGKTMITGNCPRKGKVRECYVARPGYYLCSVDYAAQELVTFAQAMRDLVGDGGPLMDAINNDIDAHTLFACEYLYNKPHGVSYEEGLKLKDAGHRGFKDVRQKAKCFHPETEVLSFGGWKKIADLSPDDIVMQAIPTNGAATLQWAQLTQITRRKAEPGEMVELKNESLHLRVTKDHRMLGFGQGSHKPFVCAPHELSNARFWLNAGVFANDFGQGDFVTGRWLRLAVAVQADGSYVRNKAGELKAIRLGFTKQRKVARLRTLLSGLKYKEYTRPINGKVGTFFTLRGRECESIGELLTKEKTLPWSWVHLPMPQRLLVLDEAQHWDSHVIKGGRSYRYTTTKAENADVLQAMAAISGCKSRQTFEPSKNPKQKGQTLLSIKDRAYARGGALECNEFPYEGDVVCLSVPSSFVLVRANGVTAIVGQCANFGFPGGMGVDRFIVTQRKEGLIFTKPETQELKAKWLAQWKPQKYFEYVNRIVQDYGWVSQLRSGRVRGDASFTDTANTFFSGLAADMSKDALVRATIEMYCEPTSPLFGSRIVAFIHDEILAEVPIPGAHGAAMRLGEVMVEAGHTWCPNVKSKAEPALMRRWYKNAEAVFDERGMLQPWEPKQ